MPMACPITAWCGDALGARGSKKKRNAVGPSEGKTKGVPVASATSESRPMVTKPFTNMKTAHTFRSSKRCRSHVTRSRCAMPRITSGSNSVGFSRSSGIRVHPVPAPVEVGDVPDQTSIDGEQGRGRDRGGHRQARHAAQRGVKRSAEQPELDDD